MLKVVFLTFSFFQIIPALLLAQDNFEIAKQYLQQKYSTLKNQEGLAWLKTDEVYSSHNGVTHLYLRQTYQGIEIFNANVNVALKNKLVIHEAGKVLTKVKLQTQPKSNNQISAEDAIRATAKHFRLPNIENISIEKSAKEIGKTMVFSRAGISLEPIPVKFVYIYTPDNQLVPAWDLSIYTLDQSDWWSVRVHAYSGEIIDQNNWVTKCQFDHYSHSHQFCAIPHHKISGSTQTFGKTLTNGAQYNVFAFPLESPNHGNRSIVGETFNLNASPFGWHDTNGATGAEFTTTNGNNVNAYEDRDANNVPGQAPDAGSGLNFDFPINLGGSRDEYLNAAIVNLFYWNNINHDIFYRYGFNEQAGNFQLNNYNKGGNANDAVRAEAQDGSGYNNANFATPPDGVTPRMQMFLWGSRRLLKVNSPLNLAGSYQSNEATFGPRVRNVAVTGEVVLVDDDDNPSTNGSLACGLLLNPAKYSNKIVLIERGTCNFTTKVKNAQNAGAIGVIVANNQAGFISMGGSDNTITIPSVSINQADGELFKTALANDIVLNVSLVELLDNPGDFNDSSFDNGIITHEYGHGISTRLTGGPANSNCLTNPRDSTGAITDGEQMGEGWSDYFALMLTMKSGDTEAMARSIGTYASGQAINGRGIRPAPYSTDFAINNFTYSNLPNANQLSNPHGVGFLWCTMLWDMTWEFIKRYGFDPDLVNGNKGNNKALQLVIDGLKLQPCNPGFVDGRNAILEADFINNGGANFDIIWKAFARRGLGYTATQGSSQNRADGVSNFDLPPNGVLTPVEDIQDIKIQAFPNPSEGKFNILLTNEMQSEVIYKIFNNLGQEITQNTVEVKSIEINQEIDLSYLPKGLYYLQIQMGDKVFTKKLIFH
jgi:hypothetical protein